MEVNHVVSHFVVWGFTLNYNDFTLVYVYVLDYIIFFGPFLSCYTMSCDKTRLAPYSCPQSAEYDCPPQAKEQAADSISSLCSRVSPERWRWGQRKWPPLDNKRSCFFHISHLFPACSLFRLNSLLSLKDFKAVLWHKNVLYQNGLIWVLCASAWLQCSYSSCRMNFPNN